MKQKRRFSIFHLIIAIVLIVLAINLISSLFRPATPNTVVVDNTPTGNDDDGKNPYDNFINQLSNTYSSNWQLSTNVGALNSAVAGGVRNKRTKILGNNNDKVTIMVYMCGSDLESQNAMGVYDLVEMTKANYSDNLNVIVFTGGTTKWHTDSISSRYNQIYRIMGDGKIEPLVENAGTGTMVDPDTLTSFIEYCADNYEANRNCLIFWDHGGGTVSGYGYDEKFPRQGSMSLAGIDRALTNAGVTFDFIGFDACLMATTETALMLSEHADYLIASEEAEPGIGWYYTNWLNRLSANTSLPTLEIGKNICDDFVAQCKKDTPRQTATLSVIDLAEVQDILPAKIDAFAKSTSSLIETDYRTVASARKGSREFASETYIDMVDFVDLSSKVDTAESRDLAQALMSAIKYNNTTSDISNAYGLSVYFPYRTTRYLGTVLDVYDQIDMSSDYSDCIRSFASYQGAGQVSSGGSHYPYSSYNSYDYSDYYSSQNSAESLIDILNLFMSGSYSNDSAYSDYYGYGLDSWFDRNSISRIAEYIADNHFDADLNWKDNKITLTDKQWAMVDSVKVNVFLDDGTGYIDLGKDAIFTVENGSLLNDFDKMWVVASSDNSSWQVVPFYHRYSTEYEDGRVDYVGTIPVILNGEYADLLAVYSDDSFEVAGAVYDYKGESDVVPKNIFEINEGDEIQFVCEYYDYNGNFNDAYILGDKLIVKDKIYLGDGDISKYKTIVTYEFQDIYKQSYWTQAIKD